MAEIVVEMGSANTCQNDEQKVKEMIDAIVEIDTKEHNVIFKWQLFENCPPNLPLLFPIFDYAYDYAWEKGYETTASVFDDSSLDFLLRHKIPFVKIANHVDSAKQIVRIQSYYRVYSSYPYTFRYELPNVFREYVQFCVQSRYDPPARRQDYEKMYRDWQLKKAISDHTTDWYLWDKYKPEHYECHFVLEHESWNPDSKVARTPDEMRYIL